MHSIIRMGKFTLLILFIIFVSYILCEDECDEDAIHVRGKRHKKVVWLDNVDRPYQLAYYKHKLTLFYSYNVGLDEEDTFKIAYIHKHKNEHHAMDIENGFSTAIDEHNHVVYFGGDIGIYKYHPDKNNTKVEKIVHGQNVWNLFFKHHLYYVKYPTQKLYKVIFGNKTRASERVDHIHEKIYQFAIDGNDDQYFTNDTGLYKIKNGTNDRIHYIGEKVFRGMAVNSKGDIHFSGKHGIYVTSKHNHTLEQIAHIRNIFGITFDEQDNIIYSNPYEIVRLEAEDCKKKKKG